MFNKILFLGDVYLDKKYKAILPKDYPIIFNLEAPISNRGIPIPGKVNLRCSADYLESVFQSLPLAVCLANNHIMDYGNEVFEDTIKLLQEKGIMAFGAGTIGQNYNNPLIRTIGVMKVGFLGYCYYKHIEEIKGIKRLKYSPAPLNIDLIKEDLKYLRNKVDRIILQLHWGKEESNLPDVEDVIFARSCLEMGAHCVIGHHAHCVQPIERHKQGIIAYGIGNFIFSDLNIPSHYDESGVPGRYTIKKQRPWNRSSIGVLFDLKSLEYDIEYYYFEKNQVIQKKTFFHRYANYKIPASLGKLRIKTARHRKLKRLILMIFHYLDNPKIPSVYGIKNFICTLFSNSNIFPK